MTDLTDAYLNERYVCCFKIYLDENKYFSWTGTFKLFKNEDIHVLNSIINKKLKSDKNKTSGSVWSTFL